jgi:aldose 1-epimerase
MKISQSAFGNHPDGTKAVLLKIENPDGSFIELTNWGAKLVSLVVPDKDRKLDNVVLGYASFNDYLKGHRFFGSNVGRFANRIKDGQFYIDGDLFLLSKNRDGFHQHGGFKGFDSVFWDYKVESDTVVFSRISPDGEEGYPGTLNAAIIYRFGTDHKLEIDYHATTDRPTHVNIAHHSYFNLSGAGHGQIDHHKVGIKASHFLEVDQNHIPTGNTLKVDETPLDLRKPKSIAEGIDADHPVIQHASGYDQCFVIDKPAGNLGLCAWVNDPLSGRKMEVLSTLPGLQFYTGNFCESIVPGKKGKMYGLRSAFCLEPQFYPNSPNIPGFPSTLLKPGSEWQHKVIYKFSTE